MNKSVTKSLALFVVAGSMMAASPAYAWYETAYFDEAGTIIGGEIRCDNGVLLYSWGEVTTDFINTYGGYLPYWC